MTTATDERKIARPRAEQQGTAAAGGTWTGNDDLHARNGGSGSGDVTSATTSNSNRNAVRRDIRFRNEVKGPPGLSVQGRPAPRPDSTARGAIPGRVARRRAPVPALIGPGRQVRGHRRGGLLDRPQADDATGGPTSPNRLARNRIRRIQPFPGVAVVQQARIDLQMQVRGASCSSSSPPRPRPVRAPPPCRGPGFRAWSPCGSGRSSDRVRRRHPCRTVRSSWGPNAASSRVGRPDPVR